MPNTVLLLRVPRASPERDKRVQKHLKLSVLRQEAGFSALIPGEFSSPQPVLCRAFRDHLNEGGWVKPPTAQDGLAAGRDMTGNGP